VGLRKLVSKAEPAARGKTARAGVPSFKQYREADGKFYFKLLSSEAKLLLQSSGFVNPKDAAQLIALLHDGGAPALEQLKGKVEAVAGATVEEIASALSKSRQTST
jgi:tryptophanyl-tRNA synthetase